MQFSLLTSKLKKTIFLKIAVDRIFAVRVALIVIMDCINCKCSKCCCSTCEKTGGDGQKMCCAK
uniref:Uncharacterized protein n=1 Tax=Meloidogyne enterolobii TaxID=390850 RepID=A0A6V7WXG7_MELEN|nr:unnamed protein product [Meloidogyne enterolobii]